MEKLLQPPDERRKNLTFPLPSDALPDLRLTPAQVREYRASASAIVDKTAEMERELRMGGADLAIAAGSWKLVRGKGDLRVYKRSSQIHGHPESEVQPMVLCIGTVRGTVEQTLYGFHNETTDEIRAANAVISKSHADAAVVAVMERGTSYDPLRLLTLTWRLNTPGSALAKSRDSLTLESMGMRTDRHEERFGYMVFKSVDRPEFPAFSDSIAIRSRVMLCCIFRQLAPDSVAVYAKGIMDMGGDFSDWLCSNFACTRLIDALSSTRSQCAKQLTAYAIQNGRVFLPVRAGRLGFSRMKMSSRTTMRCASIQTTRTMSNSSDAAGNPQWQPPAGRPNACLLCRKKGGSVSWLRPSLQSCQICDKMVCSKCLVKRELLAAPANIQVWCCKGCIIMAKKVPIDPHTLCPLLQY